MSQPTRAEAQACAGALLDGVPPADEVEGWIAGLDAADLSDPLVVSALELLRSTNPRPGQFGVAPSVKPHASGPDRA